MAEVGADLIVYGASDDLIETEGLVREEFNSYDATVLTVMVDDATYASLHIEYDPDQTGEWRIQPTSPGNLVAIITAPGEDYEGPITRDEHGCPCYSDKAVIDMQGIEARRVNLRLSAEVDPVSAAQHLALALLALVALGTAVGVALVPGVRK